jgi:bifunctional polynucleotide phosphatase/kinase
MVWRIVKDSLLVGRFGIAAQPATQGKRRIAAFDLDSTLITSASGRTFSRDASDWKWWDSSVPGRLKELHAEGFLVAVISNQGGISLKPNPKTVKSDQKRLADFKTKVTAVFNHLDFPISIYAATSRDLYRKPRTGMWSELLEDYDVENAESIDLENSVFVGDAGGREAVAGGVKDHSCVDRFVKIPSRALLITTILSLCRDFAANVGLPFRTPEEYFRNEDPRPFVRAFEPTAYTGERAEVSTSARTSDSQTLSRFPIISCAKFSCSERFYTYSKHRDRHVLRQPWFG